MNHPYTSSEVKAGKAESQFLNKIVKHPCTGANGTAG